MSEDSLCKPDSPAVQTHLGMSQAVIQRMASNSTSCKASCITLVAAILVVVADKGKPTYTLFAAFPTVLFLVLDTYYLALERCFRNSYNEFIDRLHNGHLVAADLYAVTPRGSLPKMFGSSLLSFSIWPFYLTLAVMIWFSKWIVVP